MPVSELGIKRTLTEKEKYEVTMWINMSIN